MKKNRHEGLLIGMFNVYRAHETFVPLNINMNVVLWEFVESNDANISK